MADLDIRIVPHGSQGYLEALELRRRILRWPLGLEYSEEQIAAESPEFHFTATLDGAIVGCLSMAPQNCSVVKMRQVAVDVALQSQGIGAAMVAASEEWATSQNYSQIELHARDVAVAFYLKLGYRVVGDEFVEVGIPHRKMVKDLPPIA